MSSHTQLSDYWLASRDSDLHSLFDLLKLQNAVANFVKIISGENIPVEFKTNNEESSRKKIIISSDLSNIDATVGIAIHETLSFMHSPSWIVSRFIDFVDQRFSASHSVQTSIPKSITQSGQAANYQTKKIVIEELKNIYYLLEYWRIDDMAIRTSPGYKGYILAAYDEYFCPNELLRLQNFLNKSKKPLNFTHLYFALACQIVYSSHYKNLCSESLLIPDEKEKFYEELHKLVDIKHISRLKHSEDTLQLSIEIWLFFEALFVRKNDVQIGLMDDENDELDQPKEFKKSKINNLTTKIKEAAGLDFKKQAISVARQRDLKNLNEDYSNKTNAYYDGQHIKVFILNRLTRDLIYSGDYPFFETGNIFHTEKAVSEGIHLGNQLARKISFRNNERNTRFSRLKKGKIDNRLLHSVACGNKDIFYQEQKESIPSVNFHISIDGSHSMEGDCFFKSLKTAVAIARAGELTRNVNITISIRYYQMVNQAQHPLLLIIYDSRKDTLETTKELFSHLRATGPTSEGLCYSTILNLMEKDATEGSDNYFINLYDGMPCFLLSEDCCYEGKPAMKHIREEVIRMKNRQINVLAYYIVSGQWKMTDIKNTFADCQYMYGKNAEMVNINDLGELAKSLNRLIAK